MKKTLAQLKRDIQVGKKIQCIAIYEALFTGTLDSDCSHFLYSKEMYLKPLNEIMQSIREVTKVQSNSFCLNGSYCNYPSSDCLEYYDNTFTIIEKSEHGYIVQKRVYIFV